jgi:DNA (cytosine-5)-methyltransferase 1
MRVYYNENAPKAAAWIRALIAAKLIPDGHVDERSICDVQPGDIKGYECCNFFAGIAGWSEALRLARWSGPVWTGSCPCQSFSVAGKQKGTQDARDLWPNFFRLIRECHPERIFGEQVAGAIGHGWLDRVCTDMEAEGYAVGSVVLGAHSVGAPHIRQRLYWVADALGNANNAGLEGRGLLIGECSGERASRQTGYWDDAITVQCADGKARRLKPGLAPLVNGIPGRVAQLRGLGNAICPQAAAEFIQAYCEVNDFPAQVAKRKGMMIVGFPRRCSCGGSAYHSPTASWQNRVMCIVCGKKWSE